MTMNFRSALAAFSLAVSSPAFGDDGKFPINGAWRMTSLQVTNSDGSLVSIPYSGQVIFSQAGTLSVQAMNPDAAAEPTTYTANGYEAYYGPVEIDAARKTFAITVESSLVRNLIGQKMERKFEVTEDQLVITPANPEEGWRVTYERL
ncbi:lipocalin-like domain-containing protein [Sinorhizobium meliloti]|uniref:lipocalin-like domain-containing protein n=2 Tax=Rhizobium meliloti TaxID=382 RepID=UPI001F238FFF|nr:lipocalin-like domain-containing protein [Sinorhizobium meliloti]